MNFKQWLANEESGYHTGGAMATTKQGYDQNLQEPEGLAYRKPVIPKKKTWMSKQLDKLFGKKDEAMGSGSQDEDAFLRGYFDSGLDPSALLVWADWHEERGTEVDNKKAEVLRRLGTNNPPNYPPTNLFNIMGWATQIPHQEPEYTGYSDYSGPTSGSPEWIEIREDTDDPSRFKPVLYRLLLKSKEWRYKEPGKDWKNISPTQIPLTHLRLAFYRWLWTRNRVGMF